MSSQSSVRGLTFQSVIRWRSTSSSETRPVGTCRCPTGVPSANVALTCTCARVSDAFAFLDRGETLPEELAATLNERYAKIRETLPREEDTTP